MQKPGSLHMRARSQGAKPSSWFRIENAHVDKDSADDEVTPVYIYDVIGDSWWEDSTPASEFIKQLAAIKTPRIELHLNSPGGDIFDGVAIYNALRAHPARVTVIVDALAASAASFIAQAGEEVIMTKAATMMIHDGSAMAWGPASVMRDTADLLDKLSNTVAEIYSDRAGQTIEFWRNLMIEETWYNSHEAVDSGLADRIGDDTKEEDDQAAQNKWDLSIFNYAGRGHAPDPMQIRQRIANRLKEMTVGKPQNTTGTPEGGQPEGTQETVNPGSPEVDPDAATTEGDAGDVQEGRDDNPGAVPENKAVLNQATGKVTFLVKGVPTEDHTAVQQHINSLEEFKNESVKSGKIGFVKQLAVDNKIMASQVEKLTNYALSLDDAGYDAWRDTWDGASAHSMLATKVAGTNNHTGSQSQAEVDAAEEIEIKKEIVANHKRGGMTNEQIMETPSYKRLVELDPEFKL